jgi:hypothetical protein
MLTCTHYVYTIHFTNRMSIDSFRFVVSRFSYEQLWDCDIRVVERKKEIVQFTFEIDDLKLFLFEFVIFCSRLDENVRILDRLRSKIDSTESRTWIFFFFRSSIIDLDDWTKLIVSRSKYINLHQVSSMNAKNRRTRFLHFSYFFFHTKFHENRNQWKLECSIKNRLLFILFRTYRVSRKVEIVRRATHFIIESMMRFKSQFWYTFDDSLWLCCMKRMIYKRKKIYKKRRKTSKWKMRMRKTRIRKIVYVKQKSTNDSFFEIFL